MRHSLLATAGLFALMACSGEPETISDVQTVPAESETPLDTKEAVQKSAELGTWGIALEDMDQSVDPGDDFFRYVNGRWLDSFEIPDEFSNYGSFTVLFERSEARVQTIIEDAAAASTQTGSIEQKIGDFYTSFLDTESINAKGLAPIQPQLDYYEGLQTYDEIVMAFSSPEYNSRRPFGMSVGVDNKNPERYVTYLSQSGLGMPNRDYYLKPEFEDKRTAYRAFLETMLGFAGGEDMQSRAAAVYALEEKLAEVHWSRAKSRQAELTYNLYTLEELTQYVPEIPWSEAFDRMGVGSEKEFVLRQHDAIQAAAKIFAETPVSVWKDYLKLHALSANATILPSEIDDARFAFYGQELSGTPQQRERWKRGVAAVNEAMGEAVGQIYVELYFPPESKAKMEELVENLKAAFAVRLDGLEWMDEDTKAEARDKLSKFTTKIGYPDEWTDYTALNIVPGDAFGNNARANRFDYDDMLANLGQPVDKSEWFMTPQTVNAYYSRNRNEIVFPAAILQAPFFDPQADPAVNYGGIGAVIGHEIGHGFDDQGRKADGTGLQRDWWTTQDAKRFSKRSGMLGRQYAAYSPIEGLFVNPELTMGENIGDLGGVTMAYDAYILSLEGKEAPVLDGYSGDQRFFMAWAQVWKRKYREDELKRRLVTDSHSPSEYRTNGVVRNMSPWYDAFGVTPEDDLYLSEEDRVQIW